MRNADPAFLTALTNAGTDGLDVRRFLWVRCVTRDPTPAAAPIGLWTGDDDVNVSVIDGQTGSMVSRLYYGMGISLQIPSIPRTSDFSIQTIAVEVSQVNNINEVMVRERNARFAKVDIHEGIISPVTGLLTSSPEIAMLGEVDGDPIDTPEAGGEGGITLEIVSDAIRSLTHKNPATRSDNGSADRFNRYSSLIPNMTPSWGE